MKHNHERAGGHKLDLHPKRIAAYLAAKNNWETAKFIHPLYVEVSPIGVCNHECTFCSVDYILDRKDAPRLPFQLLQATLSDMSGLGVLGVMFAGAGEPFLYRDKETKQDLADVICHADSVGMDTAVTTNAVLFTPNVSERAFAASRLRWIRTSINAGTRETYAEIHRTKPEDFDTVVRNLAEAVKIRDRVGSKTKILGQIVVVPETQGHRRRSLVRENYPSNIDTVVALAKTLRDIGVDSLAVKPFVQHIAGGGSRSSETYADANYQAQKAALKEAESYSTDAFKVIVRDWTMDSRDAGTHAYKQCYATPYFWAYLEADGNVWACSAHLGRIENGVEVGGDHIFRLGDVHEQSFSEIWHGERRRTCWEFTHKPPSEGGLDVDGHCMLGCQMDPHNQWLAELLEPGRVESFNLIK